MAEIRIKVEDDMSKAEETKILEKITSIFKEHPNNYLSSMFSDDLCTWASNQIREDMSLNVYEYIQDSYEHRTEVTDLDRKISDLEAGRKVNQELIDDMGISIGDHKQNTLNAVMNAKEREDELQAQINDLIHENTQLIKLEVDNGQEIRDLKVKLYDLEHPNI